MGALLGKVVFCADELHWFLIRQPSIAVSALWLCSISAAITAGANLITPDQVSHVWWKVLKPLTWVVLQFDRLLW